MQRRVISGIIYFEFHRNQLFKVSFQSVDQIIYGGRLSWDAVATSAAVAFAAALNAHLSNLSRSHAHHHPGFRS